MPTELFGVLLIPLIIGLVEAFKRSGLSVTWAAPVAIGLGLAASLGYQATQGASVPADWYRSVLWGLALGLSASGLYSGTKKAIES